MPSGRPGHDHEGYCRFAGVLANTSHGPSARIGDVPGRRPRDVSSDYLGPWRLIRPRVMCTDGVKILSRPRRRALREIERNLAESDPRLDELFLSFAERAGRAEMPRAQEMRSAPLRRFLRRGPRPDRHRRGEHGRARYWIIFFGGHAYRHG